MKSSIILLIIILLVNYGNISGSASAPGTNNSDTDSIRVLSTPDLFNLTNKWASEYKRLFPESKIIVKSVTDFNISDNLIKKGNIGFASNDFFPGSNSELLFKVIVGRDIIVPVINSGNPYIKEISEHGISAETLVQFFNNPDSRQWGTLLKNKQNTPVRYYLINDESITKRLSEFLKTDEKMINGIKVENAEEMISALQKDPYAIGFCKMVNILDFKTQDIAENVRLLPIDRNNNGIIDYSEKIYDDFNLFSRGVWIGKYPKTLFSSIYSLSSDQPGNEVEMAFLKWVVTDGQQFLYGNGYSDLIITERQTTVDKISNLKFLSGTTMKDRSFLITILFLLSIIILTGFIADAFVRYLRRKKTGVQHSGAVSQSSLKENSLIVPEGLYFDKTHTWAFMEQNGIVKVGIDDFLQHITGTITRIKMKSQGDKVKKGEQIMSIIQNGKQLNLYAPISGIIKEHNRILETNSSIVNSSPYNDGWVYKIEPSNWLRENQLLFMADKQKRFIIHEFSRLKDFLGVALNNDPQNYSQVILQDGGELSDNTLSNLGPEVWEDFQTKFIDPSRQVWFYEMF